MKDTRADIGARGPKNAAPREAAFCIGDTRYTLSSYLASLLVNTKVVGGHAY